MQNSVVGQGPARLRGLTDEELKAVAFDDWKTYPALEARYGTPMAYLEQLKEIRDNGNNKGGITDER